LRNSAAWEPETEIKARFRSRTIVGVALTRARTEVGVGISQVIVMIQSIGPSQIGVDTLINSADLVVPKTRFTDAHKLYPQRTIAMATEQPENKKRKVSPEPDAGILPPSNLLIKRLSEKAKLPTRGSALAAGYDLYR
jgi:hypothetical protein